MRKEHKSKTGGLTAAGRAYFKRKEGANLKAPVPKGKYPRRVSFAARFAGMKGPIFVCCTYVELIKINAQCKFYKNSNSKFCIVRKHVWHVQGRLVYNFRLW